MNVIASHAPSVPSTVLTINPLASEQEVSNLRALLEEAEKKASADRLAATVAAHEALRAKISSVPQLLGVPDIGAALALIVEELGLDPIKVETKRSQPKRAFPKALSDDTKAQMRSMLEANSTSRAVAEALGVGISTVDSYKAKWGLVNKGLGGRPAFKRAPKAKRKTGKSGRHLSPESRAKVVAALRKPGHRVAVIAKRFHMSREGVYQIRRQLPQMQTA